MERSLAGQLRDGMAARDGASEALYGLWLQCAVLVAAAVFALALSLLGRLLLPAENGPALATLLVNSALFVPAVILGVAGGLWPLRAVLLWKGVGPRAVAALAPLGATAVLCAATSELLVLWSGAALEELVARPALAALVLALAALPAMIVAQEMIWPWRDRVSGSRHPG